MSDPFFWMVFFSAALALNLSPGPDLLYVFSRTLSGGRRIGIISACGVCSGALVHVVFAALGISAILATSALAFTVVKYVGAAYLLYLGFQALRSAGAGGHNGRCATRIDGRTISERVWCAVTQAHPVQPGPAPRPGRAGACRSAGQSQSSAPCRRRMQAR